MNTNVQYDNQTGKLMLFNLEDNVYFKNNREYFLQLKSFIETNRFISRRLRMKQYADLRKWIDDMVPFLSDSFYQYATKAYFIFSGLTDFPACEVCHMNKVMRFNVTSIKDDFRFTKCCSFSCAQKDPGRMTKIAKTMLERYGATNVNKVKEIRSKATATRKAKNNGEYFSKESLEKARQTCIDKYGVESYPQSKEFREKSKQTYIEHFGVDNNMRCERGKAALQKALIDKYGVDNAAKCPDIQKKMRGRYLYEGRNFDTMPELAFFIWLLDNKMQFEYHNGHFFEYTLNGKTYRYFPDFKVGEKYIEIKGDHFFEDGDPSKKMICPFRKKTWTQQEYDAECEKYEAKHQCALLNGVIILYSKDYQRYLNYVDEKYGKNYLKKFRKTKSK